MIYRANAIPIKILVAFCKKKKNKKADPKIYIEIYQA